MALQINDRVRALGAQAQSQLTEEFARIDAIAETNTARVLAAFQKYRVADGYFAGTTGYGYDDLGRDKLDEIYADLFGTEAALVRIQFVNGTHAIACALFGALKQGDVLVSAVGAPYDTLLGVVGAVDKGPGSLKDYGVEYPLERWMSTAFTWGSAAAFAIPSRSGLLSSSSTCRYVTP